MALFRKLFKKKSTSKSHKGFYELSIKEIKRLTHESVKIILDVPSELEATFKYIPGQYINFVIENNGKEERRSYSICSGPDEDLAVAVKAVEGGNISKWFNETAEENMILLVSKPEGNFKLQPTDKKIVAFAAGSGITPMMSIGKALEATDGEMHLLYANRTVKSIIFDEKIKTFKHVTTYHYLDEEVAEGYASGRLDEANVTEFFKQNLDLLQADGFFLCGPEPMIMSGVETLKKFGVAPEKIHYELFTVPTLMKTATKTEEVDFKGESKVKVILDSESIEFTLKAKGKPILDILDKEGFDAPYSCRGGVCCSCKAKVLKGKATMSLNYALTDEEVEEGYILTCQAHPASEELVVSFDE
jgi:ring-1,2-phenylacetyl-CoA epoxidase subunit PaaE